MHQFKVDPTKEFEYELSCIKSDFYHTIAVKALFKIPHYFWFVPASSSGKYHPKSSLGMGGLVRHVKSVFRVAEELLNHPMIHQEFSDEQEDEIRVAILIHDGCKQGFGVEPTHTVHEHPLLPREHLRPEGMTEPERLAWERINDIVMTHMGPWVTGKDSTVVLEKPSTPAQKFMHTCDFLASRSIFEVDTTDRTPQLGYNAKPAEDWRTLPAKDTQIDYIVKLYKQCIEKGISDIESVTVTDHTGAIVLKRGEASDIISNLKTRLGIA